MGLLSLAGQLGLEFELIPDAADCFNENALRLSIFVPPQPGATSRDGATNVDSTALFRSFAPRPTAGNSTYLEVLERNTLPYPQSPRRGCSNPGQCSGPIENSTQSSIRSWYSTQ